MYDYGITYYCLFPGGGGPTSLKSVADKIYALGKKMHDETGDNQDGADDDESLKKAAGLSIDQGDQLKDPAEHNTDSSPVIASPEQGEKENSTLVTSPSIIASKIKQILNGKNEKYGVVQALDPHSLDQEPEEETVCGVRKGWIEKKLKEHVEKWEKENGEIDITCAPEEYSSDDITWYTPSPELPSTK